ncbi:MAG TPA: sigma-70 family RNA polymerase sigma factor, partial [Vicinamibacterales bacterium]|nr:sigma-70 family RNA polymerase sigma factor [Vicinamibacterales bacterium]
MSDESLGILLENHRAFLTYLERRVGDRALAEDILQDAFVKVVARPDRAPPDEALVPWFYRSLRNAAIDRYRRKSASSRALDAFAREIDNAEVPQAEMEAEICACIGRLTATLKPEYTDALMAIDVHGQSVKSYAEERGVTAGNAGVRVFRAREALKKRVKECCGMCAEHGCNDCTCRASSLTGGVMERDVVCGMDVDPAKAAATSE